MAHRERTSRHALLPRPRGLPGHSVIDIVLCYISNDPRFWAPPLLEAPASGGPRFWGPPLVGAPALPRLSPNLASRGSGEGIKLAGLLTRQLAHDPISCI